MLLMARKKKKDWVRRNFSLNKDADSRLRKLSEFEQKTDTELIEYLIMSWDAGINPEKKLSDLISKRKYYNEKISKVELEIKQATEEISYYDQMKKEKSKHKEKALLVLQRMLKENRFNDAETVSRHWEKITGISGMQLLIEAKEKIDEKGT